MSAVRSVPGHLPEPMLTYCQLNPQEQTSVKFASKYKSFLAMKSFEYTWRWIYHTTVWFIPEFGIKNTCCYISSLWRCLISLGCYIDWGDWLIQNSFEIWTHAEGRVDLENIACVCIIKFRSRKDKYGEGFGYQIIFWVMAFVITTNSVTTIDDKIVIITTIGF